VTPWRFHLAVYACNCYQNVVKFHVVDHVEQRQKFQSRGFGDGLMLVARFANQIAALYNSFNTVVLSGEADFSGELIAFVPR
jgi:hypothetical protein